MLKDAINLAACVFHLLIAKPTVSCPRAAAEFNCQRLFIISELRSDFRYRYSFPANILHRRIVISIELFEALAGQKFIVCRQLSREIGCRSQVTNPSSYNRERCT